MCFASDAAKEIINQCILRAENDDNNKERWYADFYKVHKLLYLAQERCLKEYKIPLFLDDIYARKCGPYINSLGFIYQLYKNDPITKKVTDGNELDLNRKQIIQSIVEDYGQFSRGELGRATKATKPYKNQEDKMFDNDGFEVGAEIPRNLLQFDDEDISRINEELNITI